ncbi:MAG: acyl-CoA dehydrogenase family protein [Hyphomonadaceae bacterium]
MDFSLNADHEALRDSARAVLDKEVDLAPLLAPGATVAQAGYARLWAHMTDLGWPGLVIPEAYGGLGMSMIDLTMIVGEIGRTLAPAPLFGTLAGGWAVEAAGSEEQKANILGAVAAGALKLALAIADEAGTPCGAGVSADDRHRLRGERHFVVDGAAADKLIVAAHLKGSLRWFVVDRAAPGVEIELVAWRDITRQVCIVRLDQAQGELLPLGDEASWPWVRDRLYVVLAAESAAGTRRVLDDAVAYAKERVAFGKTIGSFQAIKHALADVKGQTEAAAAAVLYAAWALDESDPRQSMAAAIAQSYASEAYCDATFRNIQVFGAIGFMWEMKNHLYFKRARANAELLGAPEAQREEILQLLETEAQAQRQPEKV